MIICTVPCFFKREAYHSSLLTFVMLKGCDNPLTDALSHINIDTLHILILPILLIF